nr:MAG TPA: hypothetical protein [Caudoviricetes sp.]
MLFIRQDEGGARKTEPCALHPKGWGGARKTEPCALHPVGWDGARRKH